MRGWPLSPRGRDLHRQDPRRERQGGPGLRLPPHADDGPEHRAGFPPGRPARFGGALRCRRLGVPAEAESAVTPCGGGGARSRACGRAVRGGGSAVVELDDLPARPGGRAQRRPPRRRPPWTSPGSATAGSSAAGDVDIWALPLEQGRTYRPRPPRRAARFESRRLLTLTDASGKELARAEGTAARGGDPALTFRPPASGRYFVRVHDRYRSRGGPAWAYRLRVEESPAADFRLTLATDTLTAPARRSDQAEGRGRTARRVRGPDRPRVRGPSRGHFRPEVIIAANAGAAELTLKAEPSAPIRAALVTVRGTAEIGDGRSRGSRPARCRSASPRSTACGWRSRCRHPFLIKGPVDFGWSPRGTVHHRHYLLGADGFTGPIEVRLADRQARHLQGVTGPVLTVPPGADEFDYPVTLPPWMEIGRTSRAVVMAIGVVREPDGTEYEVSFTTPKTELQVVAVIAPGLLGLEAGAPRWPRPRGRPSRFRSRSRAARGSPGPVHVELIVPEWLHGLSAEPLVLERRAGTGDHADRPRHDLVRFLDSPVVLRAHSLVGQDPISAEAKLTIVAEP